MAHPRLCRALAAVAAAPLALLAVAGAAAAVEVDTLPGQGWIVTPDQTSGGSARLVEGPATPPAGRGSLELGVQAVGDRARVANLVDALPADSPDRLMAALSGSWATYVPAGAPGGAAPALQLPGFLNPAAPAGTFTTLNVEPFRQGAVTPGTWQTWTLGPTSTVWHTNATDGFCQLSSPCTLAQFAAQYPAAAWGGIQLGVGSGVPGPVVGYVDDVQLTAGATALDWDFEIPAAQRSTAAIGPAEEDSGTWSVPVTLTASTLAAGPVEFTITGPGGATTTQVVPPGQTVVLDVTVPLGTSVLTAAAQGTTLATTTVTVPPPSTTTSTTTTTTTTAPTTTSAPTTTAPAPPAPPTTTPPGPSLPNTGGATDRLLPLGAGLVALGVLLVASARRRRTA